jgi:hypothetical protein
MASNVRFLDQVSVGSFQVASGGDTGSFLVNATEEQGGGGIVFTRGDGSSFIVEVTAEIFPYTGSAGISGSIDLVGTLNVEVAPGETAVAVYIEDNNGTPTKYQINGEGVPVLGALNLTPTAVGGGMFYSASNEFFLGFV